MASHLTLGLALVVALGAPRTIAQGLNDPTRPSLGSGASAFDPALSSSPAQVVIVSKDRSQATINGRTVSLGGRYGDATLVRISDEEIVLQRPEATETIKLYSSVRRTKHWRAARTDAAGKQEEENREAN